MVTTVTAHDVDIDDNSRITYNLHQTEDMFDIDSQSGQLTLVQRVSADDSFQLSITATDHGTPPRSSTANINVIVRHAQAHQVMTSSQVGMSVYVTSAVCVGCFLLVSFLVSVAVMRRRRHGNDHHHERLESHHILVDKPRPSTSTTAQPITAGGRGHLGDFTDRRLQVC